MGLLQGGIASVTGMFKEMKKNITVFTDQILDFLNDSGNREKVKSYIIEKLSEYTDKTFAQFDYTEHNRLIN
jgi:hypothetical protein